MFRPGLSRLLLWVVTSAAVLLSATTVRAQSRDRYALSAPAKATGVEIVHQPRLWVMEVDFKPMRFLDVTVTDPQTGQSRRERVWYLVYRAVHRLPTQPESVGDVFPVNDDDQEPAPPLFVPEFLLLTDDTTDNVKVQEVYRDEVVPEAEPLINRREGRVYKNTVDVVQDLPEAVPVGEDPGDRAIYGVATWRGIPAETDYFTVFLAGFSNGYRHVQGPVTFTKLREMARGGELLASNAVWDGLQDVKTASETCNWQAETSGVRPPDRDWVPAGDVPGLFDDVRQPDVGAQDKLWMYSLTPEQFEGQGRPPVWRKTLRQHFTRFGDEFDTRENEFRPCGDPTWIYQADDVKPTKVAPPAA
jgi:hypothetical protein